MHHAVGEDVLCEALQGFRGYIYMLRMQGVRLSFCIQTFIQHCFGLDPVFAALLLHKPFQPFLLQLCALMHNVLTASFCM